MLLLKILPVFLIILAFPFCTTVDCNNNADPRHKEFVFIGEKVEVTLIQDNKDEEKGAAKFLATYKIIEKVCGDYPGDTITFEVNSTYLDTNFINYNNSLFFLFKDRSSTDDYGWRYDKFYDVYKTKDGRWATPLKTQDHYWSVAASRFSAIKRALLLMTISRKAAPVKIKFAEEVWYDISAMTKEEIDNTYPEIFYKIERHKAIAVYGNYISEILYLKNEGKYVLSDTEDVVLNTNLDSSQRYYPPQVIYKDSIFFQQQQSLNKDPFNDSLIREYANTCHLNSKYELFIQYLKGLPIQYPDSVKGYLIKAKYLHIRPNLEDSSKITALHDALKIDKNHYDVNYQLAICYYDLFLQYQNSHYARQARKFLMKVIEVDTIERAFLKYPIIQLSTYLGETIIANNFQIYQYHVKTNDSGLPMGNKYNWYIPFDTFMDIDSNWQNNYKNDLFRKLNYNSFKNDWFSGELAAFKEPVLNNQPYDSYRFLCLRDSDKPFVIRIERNENGVFIYWKMPKYNRGLDIYQPDQDGKKKLSLKQWNAFQNKLAIIDFWSMSTLDTKGGSTHSDTWILEAYINGKYKLTERSDISYPHYTSALIYLIDISDLDLKK